MNFQSLLVVTYGRTGSTLLQGLLNSVQGVVVRGENFNFCLGLYKAYLSLARVTTEQGKLGMTPTRPFFGSQFFDEQQFFLDARALLRNQLCPASEGAVGCWGFKEIRYTSESLMQEGRVELKGYLDFLARLMPSPAFVFLTRDHQDVANSAFWRKKESKKAISQMEDFENDARDWSSGRNDCFWIDYEQIVGTPSKLADLYCFLGFEYDQTRIDEVLGVEHSVDSKPRNLLRSRNWSDEAFDTDMVASCVVESDLPLRVKDGMSYCLSGVVVLKEEIRDAMGFRLVATDKAGDHVIHWGIPSGKFALKHPGNPHAANARFRIDDLKVFLGEGAEVFLEAPTGQRKLIYRTSFEAAR